MQQVCLIFSNTVLSEEQRIFEIIGFPLRRAGDVSVVSLKSPKHVRGRKGNQ